MLPPSRGSVVWAQLVAELLAFFSAPRPAQEHKERELGSGPSCWARLRVPGFGRWWWYRAAMLRVLGCTTATEPGLRWPSRLQIGVKSGSSLLLKQLCWELPCSSSPGGLAVLLLGSATWPGKVSTSSVPKRTLVTGNATTGAVLPSASSLNHAQGTAVGCQARP